MNSYYPYPNTTLPEHAPYFHPMLQMNARGARNIPQYGGWCFADPLNMTFIPFIQAYNQPPGMNTCLFSQMNTTSQSQLPGNDSLQSSHGYSPATAPYQSSPMYTTPQSQPPAMVSYDRLESSPNRIHLTATDLGNQDNMIDNDACRRQCTDIEDLMDANFAGTRYSSDCTLILIEGRAAMSLAVAGLPVIGRDTYGLLALKRRLINVCKSSMDEVKANSDVVSITRALGLQIDCTYEMEEELRSLRYGKVILMMDRDEDGSHMKGLVINFFYKFWPALIRRKGFLMQFVSPLVKVWCKCGCNREMLFKTAEDYKDWRSGANVRGIREYQVRHYRSLESFTALEIEEYFRRLLEYCVYFVYEGPGDGDALVLAFEKDCEDSRKDWISNTPRESYRYSENFEGIRYRDFIYRELLFYSELQNLRSFPSAIDGLTLSERKVLHACLKKHYDQEVSVLRLMGSVFEASAYKQSMEALSQTIINMAQDFVGTNNINILMPIGQFGSRMYGGKDAGKSKYLHTKLNPIMKYIFSELDFPVLEYPEDNDIEPTYYLPIIPMILVNGSQGIGTGWKTKIPNYNPKDVIDNLLRMLNNSAPIPMAPFFKGFKGQIQNIDDYQFNSCGVISRIDGNRIRISELPIGVWTEAYKEKVLNTMLNENIRYEEHHSDTEVNFLVSFPEVNIEGVPDMELYTKFQIIKTNEKCSFVAFDNTGYVRDYTNPLRILEEYFQVRLSAYESRKIEMEEKFQFHLEKLQDLLKNIRLSCGSPISGGLQDESYDLRRIQVKDVEKDITKTTEKLEELQNKPPEDIWREELEVLRSKLDVTFPDSLVNEENLNATDLISPMNRSLHL